MGYLNNVIGYREDLLANRVAVKHGNFALLTPDGLVRNIIPGSENCGAIILFTPKLGASFADHLVILHQNDDNQQGFGGEDVETFLYMVPGNITVKAEGKIFTSNEGGYLYCPPGSLMTFASAQAEDNQILLYKHRYIPVEGHMSWLISGNANEPERIHYEDMDDIILLDFPPKKSGFDMDMHILPFALGASHGYIETHVQEHGAYILFGQGVYNLDNNWTPVKKDDHIFMGAYSLQAGYGVGCSKASSYIYSKDCNRDIEI